MNRTIRNYLSSIGRKGGRKSRRTLSAEDARAMVLVREARRAFRQFRTRCFWSFDPDYNVTLQDISWVAQQLQKYGGREGWEKGAKLCR